MPAMGMVRIRSGSALVLMLLVAIMVLGGVSAAFAGTVTTWSGVQPAGVAGTNIPITATGRTNSDGKPLVAASLKLYVDGVLIPRPTYTASVLSTYLYVYYNPAPALTDGPHTFRVEITDTAGKLSFKQWGATVAQPPSATWLAPSAGATVYTGRPRVVMSLSDNTPATTLAVAGEVRSGSSAGPVVATFGGMGLSAGSNSFTISSELVFGTHYLTATVTDASGSTRVLSGATSRSFTAVSVPAMTVLESCDSCHAATRTSHPTPASVDCLVCHEGYDGDHMEGTDYCEDCHSDGWHNPGGLTVPVTGSCTSCHSASRPGIVRHTAQSTSVAHESSCGGCHYGTLIAEHAVTKVGSSYAYQCDMCHGSTDTAVQTAIMTENTACSACHLDGFHAEFEVKHTFAGMDASCQGAGCHAATLEDAHSAFVGPGNRYPQYADTCALCHQNADPDRAPADATAECGSCHASADHESLHAVTDQSSCDSCHAATSLTLLHINAQTTLNCASCHESTDPEVVATIAAGNLACAGCHTVQGADYHLDFGVKHTYAAIDSSCQTSGCHASTLVDAHSAFVGGGNRYPQYADTCALCHGNEDSQRVPDGATAACSSCHAETHGDTGVIHTATVTSASMSILGTSFGPHACSECHASAVLTDLHGGTSSCGTCHPAPANTATPWTKGCAQGGCHTVGSSAPQHASLDTAHATTPKTCTTTAGCHSGGTNVAAIHTEQGCAACHGAGVTPTSECVSCHDMAAPHGDDRAIHATTVTTGDVKLFDNHEGYAPLSWSLDCNLCHESANLLDAHGNDCASCHSGPRGTFTTWNKTCQQGGCHVTFHAEAPAAHQNEYNTNDCETNCHNSDWSVPLENCGFCHTLVDRNPPVTNSNVKTSYIGTARIALTVSDAWPSSGNAHTYYTVDSGPQTEGTVILVPAPTTGSESHSVRFWSVDNDGNVETAKTASFMVSPDSTPPATEFDGQTSNVGPASIALLATDNGTSGVKATYYRLDGAPIAAGNFLAVPEPISGTQNHSLEFWSVDWSDNEESHQTVEFSVTKDSVAPTGSIVIAAGATYTRVQSVALALSSSDPGGSGVSQMRFSNNNSTWSAWETYGTSKSWYLASGNGAKTVWVQYRDVAGNVSTNSDGITFDSVAPTGGSVLINNNVASTTSSVVTLNLSATDTLSGVADMRLSTNGSTWGAWEPYATTKAFALIAGSGTRSAYVQFRDTAGNTTGSYWDWITVTTDTVAPTGSVSINGGAAATNTNGVTLTLSASDTGGSGLSQMRFSNDNSTWSTWETYATSKGWTLTPGDGSKAVYVQFRDADLNVSTTYSDDIVVETATGTATTSLSMNDDAWVDAAPGASGGWATFSIYADGVLIGTKPADGTSTWDCPQTSVSSGARIDIVADCGFSDFGTIYAENRPLTYTTYLPAGSTRLEAATWIGFPGFSEGHSVDGDMYGYPDYDFEYVLISRSTISNILYAAGSSDTIAPTGAISVNGAAMFTSQPSTTLTLSADDAGGSGVSQMRFSNDNSTWSAWEAYATSKSWSLASGNGAKTVYVQYRDGASNESAVYSDGITLDGTVPTGSVVVNGGASSTNNTAVTLTLSANDTGGSGLSQMRFSNDNSTWSAWEAYTTSKSWTLTSGDGAKTVYAQYRDAAGGVSSSYSDYITLSTAVGTSTLAFIWDSEGSAELHVENAAGATIASTHVEGYGSDLSWYVTVPSGQDYYLVCDYYDDWEYGGSGGGYGKWTSDTSINPDGVLSPGETVTWHY